MQTFSLQSGYIVHISKLFTTAPLVVVSCVWPLHKSISMFCLGSNSERRFSDYVKKDEVNARYVVLLYWHCLNLHVLHFNTHVIWNLE